MIEFSSLKFMRHALFSVFRGQIFLRVADGKLIFGKKKVDRNRQIGLSY